MTLGALSVMLMVCSLSVMVRASEFEMYGKNGLEAPDLNPGDQEDLTTSRMQSELYRECSSLCFVVGGK